MRSATLAIPAGRLDVDDDELGAGLADLVHELENRTGAGLQEAHDLGLADGGPHLFLDVDERLQGAVAEQDGVGHDVLGDDRGAGLDHHDGVAGAGDDEVDVGALEVLDGRVDHELAVDAADPHGADGAQERDLADRQRARRGERAEDVDLILLIGREDRDHDLDVVLVALREERAGSGGRSAGRPGWPARTDATRA